MEVTGMAMEEKVITEKTMETMGMAMEEKDITERIMDHMAMGNMGNMNTIMMISA